MLFNIIRYMYSVIPPQVRLAVLALFVSHGVSFVHNYLLKGEYTSAKLNKLMGGPYGRVVVMHIAILVGGFLTMVAGSPTPLLVVLIGLKTILDVNLHNREHKKAAAIGRPS
jgi:purine-cytosine permease-like protein